MHNLKWRDIYLIHEPSVDKEHKHLFHIASQAFAVVDPSKKREKIKMILHELSDYTKEHFEHEEFFMKSISYPMLTEHKVLHQQIIDEMANFVHTFSQMSIGEIEKGVAYFIEKWLIHHIVDADRKIHLWHQEHKNEAPRMQWSEQYRLGNATIDREHEQLFAILQRVYEPCENSVRKKQMRSILSDLGNYLQEHFEHEEAFMEKIAYAGTAHHKKLHAKIIENMNAFLLKIGKFSIDELEFQLRLFIEKNLIEHIVHDDAKMLRFEKEVGDIQELEGV